MTPGFPPGWCITSEKQLIHPIASFVALHHPPKCPSSPFHSIVQTRTLSPCHVPFRCTTAAQTLFPSCHVGKRGTFHCIMSMNMAHFAVSRLFAVSRPKKTARFTVAVSQVLNSTQQGFSKPWNWFNKTQLNNRLMIHGTGSTREGWSVFSALLLYPIRKRGPFCCIASVKRAPLLK